MSLDVFYFKAKTTPSDIHEHIDWLRDLAVQCDHVTEMGSRTGVSTTALLAAQPKKLIAYDIVIQSQLYTLYTHKGTTEFVIINESTLEIDPIEETDLLFIDTEHNYDQLIAELRRHGNRSRKWIAMHDTETYKMIGDPKDKAGLWPAIAEFLEANPHWKIKEIRTNNNGMTLLERVEVTTP